MFDKKEKKKKDELVFPAFPKLPKQPKVKPVKKVKPKKVKVIKPKRMIKPKKVAKPKKSREIKVKEKDIKIIEKNVISERKEVEKMNNNMKKNFDSFLQFEKMTKNLTKEFAKINKEFVDYKKQFLGMAAKAEFENLQKDVAKEFERMNKTKEGIMKDVLLLSNIKKQVDSKMNEFNDFQKVLTSKMEVFDKMIDKDMELNKTNKSFVGDTRKVLANLDNVSKMHTQAHGKFRESFKLVESDIDELEERMDALETQLNSAVGYLRNLGAAFNRFVNESSRR